MRTLPVFGAFGHAFKSTFRNLGFAFYASWPWMLAILPFNIAGNAYVVLNRLDFQQQSAPSIVVVHSLIGLLTMIAFASIAVNWHRHVLLGETAVGWQRLRLDGLVGRYVGNVFLLFLIFIGCEIGVGIILGLIILVFHAAASVVLVLAAVAGFLALISYSYRLGCKFPGIAIGQKDLTFHDVRVRTEGNFWRFVGLGVLNYLFIIGLSLVMLLATVLVAKSTSEVWLSVTVAIQFFVYWIITIFNVTMLTSLYGFFFEDREF